MCASLKLPGSMRGENQLHSPGVRRAHARTPSGASAPTFASNKHAGRTNGRRSLNLTQSAGDARA